MDFNSSIMGCGNVKTGDSKGVTLPTRGGSVRAAGRKLLPDPRNKLSPEVLQGFTRLVKSFYITPQPHLHKSTRSNITSGTEKQPRDDLLFDDNLGLDMQPLSSPPPDLQGQNLLSLSIPPYQPRKRAPSEGLREEPTSGMPMHSSTGELPVLKRALKETSAEAEDRAAKLREDEDRNIRDKLQAVQGMQLEAEGIMAKYR